MKKPGDKTVDETLSNDLEAFEEWESGDDAGEVSDEPEVTTGKATLDEELDIPGFDDLDLAAEEAEEKTVPGKKSPKSKKSPPEPTRTEELPAEEGGLVEDLASDVPVALVAVIGKTTTDVSQMLTYHPGQVLDLGRSPGETVDLIANGKLIARGELVEMDGKLGVRILKLVR